MISFLERFKLTKYQVNPEGGTIYVDWNVKNWLDSFKGEDYSQKSLKEIEIYKKITKSGFEENLMIKPPENFPTISLIVVTFNSEIWFENLKKMFIELSPWLHEIIVVDNGSIDGSLDGLRKIEKTIFFIENEIPKSFAAAVNQGCNMASGELFLIINPDVQIPKSSLWSLINFYQNNSEAAAIVPKLMLMKTPGFINGIGNVVPPFRWGYDLGLGHLDVGQFDHIKEVPSACFATVLIPREKWKIVGELDEEYPMYYEDSDWSYRARGLGYKILAETSSIVYHAYRGNQENDEEMSKEKLYNVTYGRLRFVSKNIPKPYSYNYFLSYAIFDLLYFLYIMIVKKFDLSYAESLTRSWKKTLYKFYKKPQLNSRLINNILLKNSNFNPKILDGFPIMNWFYIKHMLY
jgi:hypothetical protein